MATESPEGYDVLARNLRPRKKTRLPAYSDTPICSCQVVRLGGDSCGPGTRCLNRWGLACCHLMP